MNVSMSLLVENEAKPDHRAMVCIGQPALNSVLFDFNVTSNEKVTLIKALCAGVVQMMQDLMGGPDSTPAQKRAAAIAINEMEGTQMRAVKALFAK